MVGVALDAGGFLDFLASYPGKYSLNLGFTRFIRNHLVVNTDTFKGSSTEERVWYSDERFWTEP